MDNLSAEDKNFMAQCEEEFKDRFTEQDEVFMKAFNKELSEPPMLKKQTTYNVGRRDGRQYYERSSDRPYRRPYSGHRDRGDYRSNNDYNSGHRDRGDFRSNNDYNSSYRSRHSKSNYN